MAHEYLYKVVIFGDKNTGKSNFINKYISNDNFKNLRPTIGVDFNAKYITSPYGKNIKVHFWDTSGDKKFINITRSYYGGIGGAILMYDTSNLETFESLPSWLYDFNICNRHVKIPLIVIGMVTDKPRVISHTRAKRFADLNKVFYNEINVKNNYRIDIPPHDILQPVWDEIWLKFVIENNICLGVKKMDNDQHNPVHSENSKKNRNKPKIEQGSNRVSIYDKLLNEIKLHYNDVKDGCIIC